MNGSKAAVGAAEGIKAPHNVIMRIDTHLRFREFPMWTALTNRP